MCYILELLLLLLSRFSRVPLLEQTREVLIAEWMTVGKRTPATNTGLPRAWGGMQDSLFQS